VKIDDNDQAPEKAAPVASGEAATAIRALDARRPDVAVILGSGLGAFADALEDATVIPYGAIPHFPETAVKGHAGRLVIGTCGGRVVAAFAGRVHRYEGWPLPVVVFPVRVAKALGARAVVVTNAAGALHAGLTPGDLMVITDHINLTGENPLKGPNDDRLGLRFPDMSRAYSAELTDVLRRTAAQQGVPLQEGVYVGVAGPSYETAAEVRMLRILGGDVVGMSTVHEVIAAAHAGLKACGVSCVTNHTAGISTTPLTHDEVQETAERVRDAFLALLNHAIPAFPL
jgi:purine-nucleoside phosphorylase